MSFKEQMGKEIMIKKEDFLKKFPIKIKCCTVDEKYSDSCVLDTEKPWNCHCCNGNNGVKKKEDCKYWENVANWEYIEDIWNWINSYQKKVKQLVSGRLH